MGFKVVGSVPGLQMLALVLVFLLACGGETAPTPPTPDGEAETKTDAATIADDLASVVRGALGE